MSLNLTSMAFSAGKAIPAAYTCDGDDVSPPLSWSNVPPGARSLALVVEDPDAPNPIDPQRTWVHWILYNLPPLARALPPSVRPPDLPPGSQQGINDWKRIGYGGPCPPVGRHRYVHRLFALDTMLPDLGPVTRAELERAMAGHIIEQAELTGHYERKAVPRREAGAIHQRSNA
jgi:Raf kinase inhibitor-like YbhB/YbcL family protein